MYVLSTCCFESLWCGVVWCGGAVGGAVEVGARRVLCVIVLTQNYTATESETMNILSGQTSVACATSIQNRGRNASHLTFGGSVPLTV